MKQELLGYLSWEIEGLAALGIPDLQVWVDVNKNLHKTIYYIDNKVKV